MLGVHTHYLSFDILETGNSKTLVFVDSSEYYEAPDRPLIEVTLPGYTKYFLANVVANQVNTFNASTLGLLQVLNQADLIDLPDGIWKIKFKICPYKYVYIIRKHFRVTSLLKKLEKFYQQIDLSECSSKEDRQRQSDLTYVHILIEGAKAEVNKDSKKAQEYYQLADRLVQKYLDNLSKNCK